jgi:hypothetical protein
MYLYLFFFNLSEEKKVKDKIKVYPSNAHQQCK